MTKFHSTTEYARLVRSARPQLQAAIDSGEAVCVDCGRPVVPGQAWDVGHRLAHITHPDLALEQWNIGASHKRCNRSNGAKIGNARTAQRKSRQTGTIQWR